MKTSKILLGLVAILFAAVGAYATAKNTRLAPVFYQTSTQCLAGDAVICEGTTGPCEKEVFVNNVSQGIRQIYANQQVGDPSQCDLPYHELN